MRQLIKPALLGGVTLFAWSMVSWMLLPWHAMTFSKFSNEATVLQTMWDNGTESGVYLLPSMGLQTKSKANTIGVEKHPFVFLVYNRDGCEDMTKKMLWAFLEDILTAFVLAWLLAQSAVSGFGRRIFFVACLALFAGLAVHVPNHIWWGHSMTFTLVSVADLVLGWTLAGAAIIYLVPKSKKL